MRIKVYTLSVVHISFNDEAYLDTYVFNSIEKAREKFRQEEAKWIKDRRKNMIFDCNIVGVYGMTEEEFSEWLEEALMNDINHEEGMYKNYIYNDGDEKVFSIEMHEVEVA